eukprot:XP_011602157.1 PREDICTED: EGF-like module-containing mucin-like hormone receptor-like 1 [Takifugu rubripes]
MTVSQSPVDLWPSVPRLEAAYVKLDIDECMNSTVCGPESTCTNTPGSFTCACNWGWAPTDRSVEPREESNVCIDVGECVEFPTICGPKSNCTNLIGSYNCTCNSGYRLNNLEKIPENGIVTCVYWEVGEGGQSSGEKRWSTDGCWISFAHENYTVCSCSHLSTFALIMQIAEPAPANPFLDWLNRVCVIVGLFFFGLAIFTFLLCSWNPKINNTARLHLCLNLSMSHLLLLWNQEYTENELACTVMAGLLHFLVIASFVWMLLEALQLHLLVRRLTKVQVIQRDGLPRPLLYLIGYGVPFTIVGVSALVYSDGYGATEAKMLILFKIVAQFVILGCTWILGLYQTNLFFQVLFIILNSQQGTFLFIVHCLLNKEVRDEYIKWLTCTCGKDITVRDAPSVSEDLDKQTDDGKKG